MPVAILLLLAALCFWACRPSTGRVYLLDFACLKPPESLRVTLPMYMYGCRLHQKVPPCFQVHNLDLIANNITCGSLTCDSPNTGVC